MTIFVTNPTPQPNRPPITGGLLAAADAINLMNAWFFVSEINGEVSISRVEDDGTLTYFGLDDLQLLLSNTFVEIGNRHMPISKFWLAHHLRRQCKIVFKPRGNLEIDEHNQFRGFAIEPVAGYQKQRRLLRHLWRIICKRDKIKFRYFIRWLAWCVQNPDRRAEVIPVLMSEEEGCGKSTIGQIMLDIFGQGKGRHGLLVEDKEQLLGKFNSHLETTCFVLGEEVLWAGDYSTADALKSRITASTIPIEEKYRPRRSVPNRLHVMLTTNHSWAIPAGVNARRYFVVEVSDEVAQDKAWFDPLYQDLGDGGTGEFLNFLLTLRLGDWHPRDVPKTAELAQQQVLSAGSTEQWLLACAEMEVVAGNGTTPAAQLGTLVSTQELYGAYSDFTRRRNARVDSPPNFGRILKKICGPSSRLPTSRSPQRSPGYSVPGASQLTKLVHHHLKAGP
jgi:Family of unknown function (DUF5906)